MVSRAGKGVEGMATLIYGTAVGGQRAHAEQPATGVLLVSGRSRMIAVMLGFLGGRHFAVADLVGMRHAIDRGSPVTEGEHGRRRHKAKRGEDREQNRKPEAKPVVSAVSMGLLSIPRCRS